MISRLLHIVRDLRCESQGAATVEFAIVAPLAIVFCFAAIEFGRVNMIRNTIENAAYEAAREGIVPGAEAQECRRAARNILLAVGVNQAKIAVEPRVILPATAKVTVTVSVQLEKNGFIGPVFFKNKVITKSCTLSREFDKSGGES